MSPRFKVFGLAVLLFFWSLGGHDLWAPDEPYFGEGAREMIADGQWWVVHVNGEVSTDKPPLFFWSIALASLPFGQVTPWTARLPSALAALGVLLLIFRLGRRLDPGGGERVAWLAGLVLVTTVMFWQKARWAQIDALLCLLIWTALSAFEAWRAGDADGRRAGLLFWLAGGLAILAKGPVGLLLPLGIALVTLAFDRRLGEWKRFAPLTGPILCAAVVGGWMAAATYFGAGEYSVFGALREHFLERGLHGMHHRQPFWYYLEVLPVQLLPWSGLVPGALVLAWRNRDPGNRFLLITFAFVVLFFSISTEKRDLYVLPAVPAVALLVGLFIDAVARFVDAEAIRARWLYVGQTVVGALLTLVGAALPFAAAGREEVPYWMAATLGGVILVAGLGTLFGALRRRLWIATLAPAAGLCGVFLFVSTFVYSALEPQKSARAFSQQLAAETALSRAAGYPVVAYDLSNVPEAFAFYTDGVYTVTTGDPADLERHLAQDAPVWSAMNRPGLDLLSEATRQRLTIVHEARLSRRDVLLVRNF